MDCGCFDSKLIMKRMAFKELKVVVVVCCCCLLLLLLLLLAAAVSFVAYSIPPVVPAGGTSTIYNWYYF
jgi:hypothetical protein